MGCILPRRAIQGASSGSARLVEMGRARCPLSARSCTSRCGSNRRSSSRRCDHHQAAWCRVTDLASWVPNAARPASLFSLAAGLANQALSIAKGQKATQASSMIGAPSSPSSAACRPEPAADRPTWSCQRDRARGCDQRCRRTGRPMRASASASTRHRFVELLLAERGLPGARLLLRGSSPPSDWSTSIKRARWSGGGSGRPAQGRRRAATALGRARAKRPACRQRPSTHHPMIRSSKRG